jgi:hypothetical protein
MSLRPVPLAELFVRGERAFREVPLYPRLKACLVDDGVLFLVAGEGSQPTSLDRATFLNLTFWHAGVQADVLVDASIEADVVTHAAWHHAASRALGTGLPPTAAALFLGESVASAFDVYVLGRMLRTGRQTAYLKSQMPLMAAAAADSGCDDDGVEAMFQSMAESPEAAFRDLRELLFDASLELFGCVAIEEAADCLVGFESHRFGSILHHFALSSWVLYARAHAGAPVAADPAMVVDRALRAAPVALDWLETNWLGPG